MVVCGDGACGMCCCWTVSCLTCSFSRQDVITECFHEGFLHTSLVCTLYLIGSQLSGESSSVYSEPTVFENYVHDIHVDDQLVELSLWDTAGELDHRSTRSYVVVI